jgi:uncharacterized protein (TIGR03435 family)
MRPSAYRTAADDLRATNGIRGTAVQEQLGLELDSQPGPVKVLVIGGVENPRRLDGWPEDILRISRQPDETCA